MPKDQPQSGEPGSKLNADAELYRIAYEQSNRALDEQRSELDGIRQRVTAFMALVVSATAFLVGTGLRSGDRNGLFWVLAGLASAATLLALGKTMQLLRPCDWETPLSGKALIDHWIEPVKPSQPTTPEFLRQTTYLQEDMRAANEIVLVDIRSKYEWVIASGAVGVVLWAALLWAHASPS